ncbi:hypothetical protein MHYP_G00361070 [Metynnis hypsauchen]
MASYRKSADSIFKEFHASDAGGHCGKEKTNDAISTRYYWPGMTIDINKWIKECSTCQMSRPIKHQDEYTPIIVNEPWELVGMDLIGKLTVSSNGNQYICVLIDYFTKWVEAYPLASKSADVVTACIVQIIYRFGAPKRILTDQGREFVNQINKEVCDLFGIKRSLCSPYHPQTNGLVEKMNGTIQRILGKLCKDKPQTWEKYLDAVLFSIRTKKQLTTQYSPFFLMFGREARYFSEVPESFSVNETVENVLQTEILKPAINMQDKVFEAVKRNMQAARHKVRARKEAARAISHTFAVGEKVLRRNIRSQQRKGGKLDRDFLGPFTITSLQGKSADLIDDNGIEAVGSGRSGCVLMAKIGKYKIFDMDIARLAPGKELESEVINAYIFTRVRKHNQENEDKAYMIDSFAMTKLWQGSYQILRKCDASQYKVLLGVINEHHHWTIAVIYPSQKRTVFLDPMGESQTKVNKCLETTRAFMRNKGCKVSRWTCDIVPHPVQREVTSCGVFVCKFAEKILQDQPITFLNTDKAVHLIRKEMAMTLLQESEDLTDLCHFCGEEINPSDQVFPPEWIACDGCGRWFHQSCVGNPQAEEDFYCSACAAK